MLCTLLIANLLLTSIALTFLAVFTYHLSRRTAVPSSLALDVKPEEGPIFIEEVKLELDRTAKKMVSLSLWLNFISILLVLSAIIISFTAVTAMENVAVALSTAHTALENAGVYSCTLDAAAPTTANTLATRSTPGVYICTEPNWGGTCTYHPSVPYAVCQSSVGPGAIPVGYDYSFGPDKGLTCGFIEDTKCEGGDDLVTNAFEYPGLVNVGEFLRENGWTSTDGPGSWVCSVIRKNETEMEG